MHVKILAIPLVVASLHSFVAHTMDGWLSSSAFYTDTHGNTVLHRAVLQNQLHEITRISLSEDARWLMFARNSDGLTPQQLAFSMTHSRAFSLLFKARDELFNGAVMSMPEARTGVILPSFTETIEPLLKRKLNNSKNFSPSKRQRILTKESAAHKEITLNTTVFNANISQVRKYLKELRSRVDPKSILLILDLDGTITDSQEPCDEPEIRGEADSLIYENKLDGVEVLISSAWFEPIQTIKTIDALNLGSILECDSEPLTAGSMHFMGREFDWYRKGRVCGLREKGKKFYRHKGLVPLLRYSSEEIKAFRYVIFVDDGATNHGYFPPDIITLGLAKNAIAQALHLSSPSNEPEFSPSDSEEQTDF